jgi:hypothetical protein
MTPASDLSVAEYFARLASSYGAGEYYRKRHVAAVAELGRRLGKIESLLDLGCGNGTYLSGFREVVDPKFLVGADLSFRMGPGGFAARGNQRDRCRRRHGLAVPPRFIPRDFL